MKTCLIAAAGGYKVEDLKPWVNSLKKVAFEGDVIVVVYDPQDETVPEYLKSQNIGVMLGTVNGDLNIATQRFLDFSGILSGEVGKNYDIVITTDIRDVVFQQDPGKWVRENIGNSEILATGEGIKYKHEDWNGDMLQRHYGNKIFDIMKNYETLCSGIIAGKRETIIKLFKTVAELAYYGKEPAAFVDQCYYNLAIRKIFDDKSKIAGGDSDWCANLGTLYAIPMNTPQWSTKSRSEYDSNERFRTHKKFTDVMICDLPQMIGDQVCNAKGEPYAIVHQYDRYQPWKEILTNKFA
jgi:hypothetical protein